MFDFVKLHPDLVIQNVKTEGSLNRFVNNLKNV